MHGSLDMSDAQMLDKRNHYIPPQMLSSSLSRLVLEVRAVLTPESPAKDMRFWLCRSHAMTTGQPSMQVHDVHFAARTLAHCQDLVQSLCWQVPTPECNQLVAQRLCRAPAC